MTILKEFLDVLFDDGELISPCRNEQDVRLASKDEIVQRQLTPFFSINPLHTSRKDVNVTTYRNLLFEFDGIPLEQQLQVVQSANLPYTTCVFSGKKSYHFIVSLLQSSISSKPEYTQVWKRVAARLNDVSASLGFGANVVDQQCKNPSRLSRMPGFVRDGSEQRLIECKSRVNAGVFSSFLSQCPQVELQPQRTFTPVSPLDEKEGQLSLRTTHFLRTGKDYKKEYGWHQMFVLAAKDMKAQNIPYDQAFTLLEAITGHLDDEHDVPQLDYAYNDESFEMDHRRVASLKDLLTDSYWIYNIEDDSDNFIFNPEKGLIKCISKSAIRRALTKEDFEELVNKRTLDCELTYEPFRNRVLHKSNDELDAFNRYHPPKWKKDYFYHKSKIVQAPLPQIYHDFFMHFTNGDEDSYEYLLDWASNSLKSKNRTYLLCIAAKGIGKNILYDILEGVHGKTNSIITNDTVLKEKFNKQLMNKTLIAFNEVDIRRDSEIDRLKAYADDYMSVEGKGKDAMQVRNYASVLIYSNRSGSVRIEADDRRFSVLELTDTKLQHSTYFKHTDDGSYNENDFQEKIEELLDENNLDALARFLWHRKISHNMNFPFRSKRYEEMIESALTEWELLMLEKVLPSNLGKTVPIRRVQKMITDEFWALRQLGRSKLKDFVKKYSNNFEWRRSGSERLIHFKRAYYDGSIEEDKKYVFK